MHISNGSLAIGMKPTGKCQFTFYKNFKLTVFSQGLLDVSFLVGANYINIHNQ